MKYNTNYYIIKLGKSSRYMYRELVSYAKLGVDYLNWVIQDINLASKGATIQFWGQKKKQYLRQHFSGSDFRFMG